MFADVLHLHQLVSLYGAYATSAAPPGGAEMTFTTPSNGKPSHSTGNTTHTFSGDSFY